MSNIIDSITVLRMQIANEYGEPPDFIDMMVAGDIKVAGVSILPGARWGTGVNVA